MFQTYSLVNGSFLPHLHKLVMFLGVKVFLQVNVIEGQLLISCQFLQMLQFVHDLCSLQVLQFLQLLMLLFLLLQDVRNGNCMELNKSDSEST